MKYSELPLGSFHSIRLLKLIFLDVENTPKEIIQRR